MISPVVHTVILKSSVQEISITNRSVAFLTLSSRLFQIFGATKEKVLSSSLLMFWETGSLNSSLLFTTAFQDVV